MIKLYKGLVTTKTFINPTILLAPSRNFSHEILVSTKDDDNAFIEITGSNRFVLEGDCELKQNYKTVEYVPEWDIDAEPDPSVALHTTETLLLMPNRVISYTFELPTLCILETSAFNDKYYISRDGADDNWFPISSRQVSILVGTVYFKTDKEVVINTTKNVKTAERHGTVMDFTRAFLAGMGLTPGPITDIEINEDTDMLDITSDSGDRELDLEYILKTYKENVPASDAGENLTKEEFLTYCNDTLAKTGTYTYTGTDSEDDAVIYVAHVTKDNSICYDVSVTSITTINEDDL